MSLLNKKQNKEAQDAIDQSATVNQYGVSSIPYHTHNGVDSPLITTPGSAMEVNSITAGIGISTSSGSGNVTLTNTGVTSLIAGSGITISSSTGDITISSSTSQAISIDNTASSTLTTGTNNSYIHNVSGNASLLIVALEGHLISTDIITSITCLKNSVDTPMQRLNALINIGGESLWCYYILNPEGNSGGSNIKINTTQAPNTGGGAMYACSADYFGTYGGGFPEESSFNSASSASTLAYSASLVSTTNYTWGITVNGSDTASFALSAASGNGSVTSRITNSRCILGDTNGSINPPTVLTTGITSGGGTHVLMYIQMFVAHA